MLRNFSFVVEGKLAGCAHPESCGDLDEALEELKSRGIGAIVSLDESGLPLYLIADHDLHHLHLPVPDFGVPSLEQARQFVEFVNKELETGRKVAVHCGAGYGRTGTMLACYLVSQGIAADQAIAQVRSRRPGSIETYEQQEFVRLFGEQLSHEEPPPPVALKKPARRARRKKKPQ